MGVNVYIHLPLYAPNKRIIQLMAKMMGHEAKQIDLDSDDVKKFRKTDFSQPCSSNNRWYIDFDQSISFMKSVKSDRDFSYAELYFKDLAGQDRQWFFSHEAQFENPFKHFLPSSTAVNIALGKRLVDYFGGKVTYQDHDEDNVYVVDTKDAIYQPLPAYMQTSEYTQEQNEQWHNWQNFLKDYPFIDLDEILDAEKYASYDLSDRDKKMMVALKPQVEKRQLNQTTPEVHQKRSSPRL